MDMILVYELRINAEPESTVTHLLSEAVEIITAALKGNPGSPVMIKIRRSQMSRQAYEALPEAKKGEQA